LRNSILILVIILVLGCRESQKQSNDANSNEQTTDAPLNTQITETKTDGGVHIPNLDSLADTTFIRLADYSDDFVYDMRYATTNNFLKAKVYPCAECYTRVKTAKALIKANTAFMNKGYRIKFFDCYRPNDVQYKMWEIVPNPQYVANPVKGSIHNKGGAVDITLVGINGEDVTMGTDFDFFGKKAYHDNTDLPQEILNHRTLLKETMEGYGFWSIRTEWWHYNLAAASNDAIANFKWECPE